MDKIETNKGEGVKYCNISDTLEQCPFYFMPVVLKEGNDYGNNN